MLVEFSTGGLRFLATFRNGELTNMSSTQLTDPPSSSSSQPHPAQPEPEGGKGSVIRKVVGVLVMAASIGGTVWKIRINAATQTTTNQRSAQAEDRPLTGWGAAVEQ